MLKAALLDAIAECEAARAAVPDAQRHHLDDLLSRLHEAMIDAVGPVPAPPVSEGVAKRR